MDETYALRRHLYECVARLPRRDRPARRALRRQIALLAGRPDEGGGTAGVREPRRPHPPADRPGQVRRPG